MARLFGAQRMVLQSILNLPKDTLGFVTDGQIAQDTRIAPKAVKDWIETPDEEGLVEAARTTAGVSVSITAKGRLQLGLSEPISTTDSSRAALKVTQSVQPSSTSSPADGWRNRESSDRPSTEKLPSEELVERAAQEPRFHRSRRHHPTTRHRTKEIQRVSRALRNGGRGEDA